MMMVVVMISADHSESRVLERNVLAGRRLCAMHRACVSVHAATIGKSAATRCSTSAGSSSSSAHPAAEVAATAAMTAAAVTTAARSSTGSPPAEPPDAAVAEPAELPEPEPLAARTGAAASSAAARTTNLVDMAAYRCDVLEPVLLPSRGRVKRSKSLLL